MLDFVWLIAFVISSVLFAVVQYLRAHHFTILACQSFERRGPLTSRRRSFLAKNLRAVLVQHTVPGEGTYYAKCIFCRLSEPFGSPL